MTRKFFFFSEMGYNAYPVEAFEKYGYSALLFPNSIFDPEKARDLWQMFLREHEYASEMGFDGSVCNEHHNNVLSMQESVNISAAVISQRIKGTIALIGNPLPIHDNPVRVAEEIAMLDLISSGRIISGFVRGTGIEQLSTNANPAYNRERFEEAFALIKKAWTVPGPFRWEGKHYHLRVVNPWQLPLQKPHPPIWAAGILSPETIRWAAKQRITYHMGRHHYGGASVIGRSGASRSRRSAPAPARPAPLAAGRILNGWRRRAICRNRPRLAIWLGSGGCPRAVTTPLFAPASS